MNIHTPSQHVLVKQSFAIDITAGAVNGQSVDASGFTRAMAVVAAAPSGTGTSSVVKLQESSDNATFTDVPGATFAAITTAGGSQVLTMNINLSVRKRYLRLVSTGSGASTAGPAFGLIELFNPNQAAVTQDNSAVSV